MKKFPETLKTAGSQTGRAFGMSLHVNAKQPNEMRIKSFCGFSLKDCCYWLSLFFKKLVILSRPALCCAACLCRNDFNFLRRYTAPAASCTESRLRSQTRITYRADRSKEERLKTKEKPQTCKRWLLCAGPAACAERSGRLDLFGSFLEQCQKEQTPSKKNAKSACRLLNQHKPL